MFSTLHIPVGHTLFCVSDLHLSPKTPLTIARFQEWLINRAHIKHHLLILGDLFELWLGDDAQDNFTQTIASMIHKASQLCPISFIHGNRDFLLSGGFAKKCQLNILQPYVLTKLGEFQICFSHGDAYCTDDNEYQTFRKMSRQLLWQEQILKLPLADRKALGAKIRSESMLHKTLTSLSIQDVNPDAIKDAFAGTMFDEALQTHHPKCDVVIHGHTHRPAVHHDDSKTETITKQRTRNFELQKKMRVVLPDWRCDETAAQHQNQSSTTFGEISLNHSKRLTFWTE